MFHVVYLSFESSPEGRVYIGKHSTMDLNDGYLGSASDTSFAPDSRIILGYFRTAKAAVKAEIQWQRVFRVVEDESFANKSYQTSEGFDTTGSSWTLGYKRVMPKKHPDECLRISERMKANNPMKNSVTVTKVISKRRSYVGSENPNSRLDSSSRELVKLLRPHFKRKVLSLLFGVSESTIKRIKWRES